MHRVRYPLAWREDDNEREEVQRERYHPQQRNGRYVGGYKGRDPQHQARRHERQPHPPGPAQPGRPARETTRRGFQRRVRGERRASPADRVPAQGLRLLLFVGRRRLGAPQHHGRGEDQHHQQPVPDRPPDALVRERELPLYHQRVAQKPYDAAQVRGPVQEVGVPGGWVVGVGQPTLHQRIRRRDGEERKPNRDREEPQEQEDRVGLR